MSDNNYLRIRDLRGGLNQTDEPQFISDNQVTVAHNIDWMKGPAGGKRAGCVGVSLNGSVMDRVVPTLESTTTKAVTGVNTTTVTVPPYVDDGTGTTYVYLIAKIVHKVLATTINAITFNGVAMTSIGSGGAGNSGKVSAYYKAAVPLAGGTFSITWSANVDAAIVCEVWRRLDQVNGGSGFVGTSALVTNKLAADPTFMVGDVVGYATGGSPASALSPNTVTTAAFVATTAAIGTSAKVGLKPFTAFVWGLASSVDWAEIIFTMRGALSTAFPSVTIVEATLRHTPTDNIANDELWIVDSYGRIDRRVGGTWQNGVPVVSYLPGCFSLSGYDVNGASLHGKFFISMYGALPGTQVWDGTVLRFAGWPEGVPQPSAANRAGVGTFSGTRYYRVRFTQQNGSGVTIRRSEPSVSLAFVPSGANTGATVTKAALTEDFISLYMNGQTHWELEASLDNVLFYRIATTVVGTASVDDTTALATTYAAFPLSENIGEYNPPPMARLVCVDGDRVIFGGDRAIQGLTSRVQWTPVANATGVGNDERVPVSTENFIDLDALNGGGLESMCAGEMGQIFAFKRQRVYKLTRTGVLTNAYQPYTESHTRGSVRLASCSGQDENGSPCVYFVDPAVGLCRVGAAGVQSLGDGVQNLWNTVTINYSDAQRKTIHMFYWPARHQVWISYSATLADSNGRYFLVFNCRFAEPRAQEGDNTRGFARYESTTINTGINQGVLFPDSTTLALTPFVGAVTPQMLQFTLSATDDAGMTYRGYWTSKAYVLNSLFAKFGVMAVQVMARAANAVLGVALIRDLGKERDDSTVSLAPAAAETHVFRPVDDAVMSECFAVQVEVGDPSTYTGAQLSQTWTLDEIALKFRAEEEAVL